ncbi:MAG: histidine kinase [Planctomycetaceae bacterium]
MNRYSQRVQSTEELRYLYRIEGSRGLVFIDDWLDRVHETDRQKALMDLERSFAEGTRYRSEFRIVRGDGSVRYILAQGQVQQRDDPDLPVLVAIHVDVTRQRELEQAMTQQLEREQNRISQELHDGIGQQLTGLGLLARSLDQTLRKEASPHAQLARDVAEAVPTIVREFRQIIRDLMPAELDAEGLPAVLTKLAADVENYSKIECHVTARGECTVPNDEHARQLFRIVQEAVNNAVKHSNARRLDIVLDVRKKEYELTVSDDGVGLAHADPNGMGMRVFRHRVESLGARLDIWSEINQGTTIKVCWHERIEDGKTTWSRTPNSDRR